MVMKMIIIMGGRRNVIDRKIPLSREKLFVDGNKKDKTVDLNVTLTGTE